jgi:putative transposase
MRASGLIGASRRRGTIVTTRRDKEARPAPDLVDRDFTAFRPNQLWVSWANKFDPQRGRSGGRNDP